MMLFIQHMKRKYSNKYFLSITLLSFFLLILLTSLALSASFSIYKNEVMNKAISVHTERLNSYSTQINNQYNKILSTTEQLVTDKMILDWIYKADSDRNLYQNKQIIDRLRYISIFNDSVISLEIYNGKSGSIISNYYGFNAGNNENEFMRARKSLYTNLMSSRDIKQLVISSEQFNDTFTPTFTLLSSVPMYKPNGAIGMIIQTDKLIPANIQPTEHIFIVDGQEPSTYFSNSATELPIPKGATEDWIRYVLDAELSGNMSAVEIDGIEYYTAYRSLFNKQFNLLILVQKSDIAAGLETFSFLFRLAFLIILILSIICSIFIYRIANKPIKRIAESVSRKMNERSTDKNVNLPTLGLQYLDHTFDLILNNSSKIEKVLESHQEFFKENALRSLIYGKHDEEAMMFYGEFNRSNVANNFIILIFNPDSHHQKMAAHVFEHADTLIFNKITKLYGGDYIRTGFRQFTMLINLLKSKDRIILLNHIQQLQESLLQEYGSTLTVGVSSVKNEIQEIHLCYNEAQEAIRYKTLLGNNRIIDSMQLQDDKNRTNSFSIEEGQLLIKKLRTASEEEITDTINKMIDEKKHKYSVEMLNAFLLYISSCIGQVGMEYNISPDVIFDNNLFKIIAEYDSINEMKICLINQCKTIIEIRNMEQKKYKKLSGEIAIKYIEENYSKPISLEIVASELNMSTSYLSRLIKQELGKNFTMYLNQLRVDKAIEYLREGHHTVKDISAAVGYDNEHTFIRNFKGFVGKTPADYRNTELRKSQNTNSRLINPH